MLKHKLLSAHSNETRSCLQKRGHLSKHSEGYAELGTRMNITSSSYRYLFDFAVIRITNNILHDWIVLIFAPDLQVLFEEFDGSLVCSLLSGLGRGVALH